MYRLNYLRILSYLGSSLIDHRVSNIKLNKLYHVEISQRRSPTFGIVMLCIKVSYETTHCEQNKDPRIYDKILLLLTGDHNVLLTSYGYLTNLRVQNLDIKPI